MEDRELVLLEDLGAFNLIRHGGDYWGLHKSLGPTDVRQLGKRDYGSMIYYGATADEVRAKVPPAR
jgi:hypothetical protein